MRQDMRRVERTQQALFALVDSLAKIFFTCGEMAVDRSPNGAGLGHEVLQKRRNASARRNSINPNFDHL
jgi:hypothetical protein